MCVVLLQACIAAAIQTAVTVKIHGGRLARQADMHSNRYLFDVAAAAVPAYKCCNRRLCRFQREEGECILAVIKGKY
jgi:hypothetical protein